MEGQATAQRLQRVITTSQRLQRLTATAVAQSYDLHRASEDVMAQHRERQRRQDGANGVPPPALDGADTEP
jgi:hypothetical protein